jgi:hypothetical protein
MITRKKSPLFHPSVSRLVGALLMAAVLATGSTLSAATRASDNTTDPAYSPILGGGHFNTLNGGNGFGPWAVQLAAADSAGDTIQFYSPNYLFAIIGSLTGSCTATRPFTGGALNVNQTFSTDLMFRHGEMGSRQGFQLQDASGTVMFDFYQQGNDSNNGYIVDAGGTHVNMGISYAYATSQNFSFTLTNATTYILSINGSIKYTGTVASGTGISRVMYYTSNNDDNILFNNLNISAGTLPPAITIQPQPATMFLTGPARFTVLALGLPPLTFQWMRGTVGSGVYTNLPNDSRFSGVNTASLLISNVMAGDAADYVLSVTNAGGAANSNPATLTTIPNISTPGAPTIILGSAVAPYSPQSSPFDISVGVTDWFCFNPTGVSGSGSAAAAGPHSFAQASTTNTLVTGQTGNDSQIYLSFEGGDGATANTTANQYFVFSPGEIHFTHKLTNPVEVINVWWWTFNCAADMLVSSSAPNSTLYQASDIPMPYNPDGDGSGNNHGYGMFTYLVTGNGGDTITFSITPDQNGVTGGGGGSNAGFQAASMVGLQSGVLRGS